jgi:hypothetical protein
VSCGNRREKRSWDWGDLFWPPLPPKTHLLYRSIESNTSTLCFSLKLVIVRMIQISF